MLASVKTHLEVLPAVEVNTFLVQIETLFMTQFSSGNEGNDGGDDGSSATVFLDEPAMQDHVYTLSSPRQVKEDEISFVQEVFTEEGSSPNPHRLWQTETSWLSYAGQQDLSVKHYKLVNNFSVFHCLNVGPVSRSHFHVAAKVSIIIV